MKQRCFERPMGGEQPSCKFERPLVDTSEDRSDITNSDRLPNWVPYVWSGDIDLLVWDRAKTPKLREYNVSDDPKTLGKGSGSFGTDRQVVAVTTEERPPKMVEAKEGQYFLEQYNKTDAINKGAHRANLGLKGVNAGLVALDAANFYLENRDTIDSVVDFAQQYGESIVNAVKDTAAEAVDALVAGDIVRLGDIAVDTVNPVPFAGRLADNIADVAASSGVISEESADFVHEVTDQVSETFVDQLVNRLLDPFGIRGPFSGFSLW